MGVALLPLRYGLFQNPLSSFPLHTFLYANQNIWEYFQLYHKQLFMYSLLHSSSLLGFVSWL